MRRLLATFVLAFCLWAPDAPAATNPDEVLDDPKLEARARDLGKRLRCLVCQNQSIDDSDADLARDLRQLVREQLVAGKSDEEIIKFLTERYGDFILLKPPVEPATWGLWFGPAAVLVVAAGGLGVYLRRRRGRASEMTAPLCDEEQARLDALIGKEQRSS